MTPTENIEGFHHKVSRTEKELSRTLIENGTCASRADPEKQKSHSPAALNGLAAIEPALSKILCDLLPNVVRSCRLKDPKHPELLPQSID